ncbi:MAG TPA: methyltransferase [Ktedonobacteraceae bacterium]
MLHSLLLADTVQIEANNHVIIINSAADPFVTQLVQQQTSILLAEDNIASVQQARHALPDEQLQHVAFHNYITTQPPATADVAILNLLYQPGNTWVLYGLHLALYALRPGGCLYVVGAKNRGILTVARRLQEIFGNVRTLTISKGHRVLCASKKAANVIDLGQWQQVSVFAGSQLDEGTALLLEALKVYENDEALDLGCGAGFIGLHIAARAIKGHITMIDSSLAAVEAAQNAIEQSGLSNIRVLAGDSAQAITDQRFDLVATNPPFHQGGIQTGEIAVRFIQDAARVLRSRGRFYVVANRFLKYELTMREHFRTVEEIAGNGKYKVLLARR